MKRQINNIVSVAYSLVRFSFLKLIRFNSFHFHPLQRFSPSTQLYFIGNGKIKLNKKIRAHTGVRIRAINNGEIEIGENTSINYGCMFFAMHSIKIGTGVEFGPNVLIYDHDHDFRTLGGLKAGKYKVEEVQVGNNCWIGANTVILRGTVIGDNCVVGAGSVIKGKYPANSIIVQKRITETIQIL